MTSDRLSDHILRFHAHLDPKWPPRSGYEREVASMAREALDSRARIAALEAFVDDACTGDRGCIAERHIEGCYATEGGSS
jgi:hypothetical protein